MQVDSKIFTLENVYMAKKKMTIEELSRTMQRGFVRVDKKFEGMDKKFDDFAVMVKRGFDQTATKEDLKELAKKDEVNLRFAHVTERLDHIDARLAIVEHDVAEIRKHFVYRDEFDEALERIATLEKRAGIKK